MGNDVGKPFPGNDNPAGVPRWVKVFGIVGAVLVVAIVAMLLTGYGPGHHMHGAGPARWASPRP